MKITFYKYTGERNRLNKTLTNGATMDGNFTQAYYRNTPRLKIVSETDFDYNYCYIEDSNRYYFIDSVMVTRNNFYECTMTLDVLMTYKNDILKLSGTVTRSTNFNYLDGNSIPQTSKTNQKQYVFKTTAGDEYYDDKDYFFNEALTLLVGVGSV